MDRVHKSDFGGPGISQKIGLRHVEQGISSFFAKKKLPDLMISQSSEVLLVYSTLKNHQIQI